MLQEIRLPHLPPGLPIYVALYRSVGNAAFLKEQLLAGNTDFEYAFIDATIILSTTHALAAVFRAINDFLHERLRTRNVHSEIVFALSPNNNIGEAFRKFGVSEKTTDLLVIKVATSPEVTFDSVKNHLGGAVRGMPIGFDDESLSRCSDVSQIRKAYKIAPVPADKKHVPQLNGSINFRSYIGELEIAILGGMALRGAT
jgi:EKC/KEOPS complex subunit CGI121/TPRKB